MPIHRLNHAVLYVRDVRRSVNFYSSVLGFRPVSMLPEGFRGAAFLQAPGSTNEHDIGPFEGGAAAPSSPRARGAVSLYHLAWAVATLSDLERVAVALAEAGGLVGAS